MTQGLTRGQIEDLAVSGEGRMAALACLLAERAVRTTQVLNALSIRVKDSSLGATTSLLRQLPQEFQSDVAGHPLTALWAQYCLEQVRDRRDYDPQRDLDYYKAVVGAAAIRARRPFELHDVPTYDGAVVLPGVGRAVLETRSPRISLDPEIIELATILNLDQRLCWRLRNLRPNEEDIDNLAKRWTLSQFSLEEQRVFVDVYPNDNVLWSHYRRKNLVLGTASISSETNVAHVAFARQEYKRGYDLYKAEIEADPANEVEAWAGFSLMHKWAGSVAARKAVFGYPEVVRSVYRAIQNYGCHVDPADVADWLGGLERLYMVDY